MEGDDKCVRSAVRKASSLDDLRLSSSAGRGDDGLLDQERKMGRHGSSLLHIAAYFGRCVCAVWKLCS